MVSNPSKALTIENLRQETRKQRNASLTPLQGAYEHTYTDKDRRKYKDYTIKIANPASTSKSPLALINDSLSVQSDLIL
jgi:hypothetical protein